MAKPRHTQPGLMDPPTSATGDRAQQQWQSQLTQVLRTGLGQSKDKSGKFLTWTDLENEGIVVSTGGSGGGHMVNPDSGGSFVPEEDRTPPPAPENVSADGGMTAIYVTWDDPGLDYNYRVEIHRSAVDDVGTAVLHGSGIGTIYQDVVGSDKTTYYYWARFVKQLTTDIIIGLWNKTEGTPAAAAEDPGWILDQVKGKIDDTHLNDLLSGEIGKIPGIESNVKDNRVQIDNNRTNLDEFETETAGNLESVRENLTGLGNQITTETIERKDADEALSQKTNVISADLSTETQNRVAAIQAEETARVTEDEALAKNIQQVASDFSSADADITAALKTEEIARTSADEALGQRITTVSAELSDETADRIAGIKAEETARVTQDEVLAQRITTVQAGYQDADQELDAAITSEQVARTSADEALATRIDKTVADYQSEDAKLQGAITTETTARTDADKALAGQITSIIADYNAEDARLQGAINTESEARATKDEALARQITTLEADFESGDQANNAAIQEEAEVRASEDEVLANQITTVRADFQKGDQTNSAAIQSEAKARADADSAMASQIDTVEADMDGVKGAVQVNSSAIGTVEDDIVQMRTEYTVKLDSDGYVGGFGLVNENQSITALFRVDTFGIGAPGKEGLSFAVDGDRVVMNGAYIQDASITDAKIENLTVDKLIGGTADFVEANIRDGSITNAKIGNYIQSINFETGVSGWQINKNGQAEFMDLYARGVIDGSIIRGSVIEGGLLIDSGVTMTVPTESDQGPNTRRYLCLSGNAVSAATEPFESNTWVFFNLATADYIDDGWDNWGDGQKKEEVWNNFNRYQPFIIQPVIILEGKTDYRIWCEGKTVKESNPNFTVVINFYGVKKNGQETLIDNLSININPFASNDTFNQGHYEILFNTFTGRCCLHLGDGDYSCSSYSRDLGVSFKLTVNKWNIRYTGNYYKIKYTTNRSVVFDIRDVST